MAIAHLSNQQHRQTYFTEGIPRILHYWQQWLIEHSNDATALEQAWPGLLKPLRFALDAAICLSTVYALIENLAPYMERCGHWGAWHQTLVDALALAQRQDNFEAMASLSALLGRLAQRQSQLRDVLIYYRQGIRLSRQTGNLYNEGRACTNLGYYFIEHGQWGRAETLCRHALSLFEQIDSAHGQAHTQNHLGILYTKRGAWYKAQHHLKRACTIWDLMGDEAGLMLGYINLGCLYNDMAFAGVSPFEDPLLYFEDALTYAQLWSDEFALGKIYINQGIAHRLKQNIQQAENMHRKAETIFTQQSNFLCLAQVLDNLGLVYIDQNKWEQADQSLCKALSIWQCLDNRFGTIRTMVYLATYANANGDQNQALSWLKKAQQRLYSQARTTPYRLLQDQLDNLYNQVMAET